MQLVTFSAKNFRSIKATPKIELSEWTTVFLGPNNEGKSNLLRAFAAAMKVVERLRRPAISSRPVKSSDDYALRVALPPSIYSWKKDYPIGLQEKNPDGESEFVLEFQLTDSEIEDFYATVGSRLNGTLPVGISLSRRSAAIRILKPGRGGKALSKKARQIAIFIGRKIDFHYIPAIRTSQHALEVVDDIVESELYQLESNQNYLDAIKLVEELQEPVLERISTNLHSTLQKFLHDVKSVEVRLSSSRRQRAFRRSTELIVDDGTATNLSAKGDGVQSLAAISLIRHSFTSASGKRNLILAIEEPESHIHPGAMHRLKEVLDEVSEQHQVLLTTHNPIFVERGDISANILVEKQKAKPAASIDEVRASLGVEIQDNLRSSQYVLLVEGEEDKVAIEALLKHHSPEIAAALKNHSLAIDTLGGSTNLTYKLTQLRMSLCEVYVLLDDDKAGRDSLNKAVEQDVVTLAQATLTTCKNMKDAEFEDWLDPELYRSYLEQNFGKILDSKHYKAHKSKWSDRLAQTFEKLGKPWDKFVEMKIKYHVAQLVKKHPDVALRENRRSPFEGLVEAIEGLLGYESE